jgi:UDP:flavonoid glycosyltransferase YjiC (YdhE family)
MGIELVDWQPVFASALDEIRTRQLLRGAPNPVRQVRHLARRAIAPSVPWLFNQAKKMAQDCDLIVSHFVAYPARLAAHLAAKPHVTICLNHGLMPTGAVPPPMLPNLGSWLNRWMWGKVDQAFCKFLGPIYDPLRAAHGLAPLKHSSDVWESAQTNLILVDPVIFTAGGRRLPSDPQHTVIGSLFPPASLYGERLPDPLEAFLQAGDAPIFCTFGSLLDTEPDPKALETSTRLMVDAAQASGLRCVVQSRWSELSWRPDTPLVYPVETVSYPLLMSRCKLVLHHGGIGTATLALQAGRPNIVVGHFGDHFLWGDCLHRLGVAPKLLIRRGLTSERLADAMRKVARDHKMQECAKLLGRQMRPLDNLQRALDLIEQARANNSSAS